jgi:hypothetical protein
LQRLAQWPLLSRQLDGPLREWFFPLHSAKMPAGDLLGTPSNLLGTPSNLLGTPSNLLGTHCRPGVQAGPPLLISGGHVSRIAGIEVGVS